MNKTITTLALLLITAATGLQAQTTVKYLPAPESKYSCRLIPAEEKSFQLGGVKYEHGFYLYESQSSSKKSYAEFSLKGAYKNLNFILGTSPFQTALQKKGVLVVTADGRRILDKVLDPTGIQERYSFNVSGVDLIRFEVIEGSVIAGIAEPTLWAEGQTPKELGELTTLNGDKPLELLPTLRPYQQNAYHKNVVGSASRRSGEMESVRINAKDYNNGLSFYAAQQLISNTSASSHFNIGGKYNKLSFIVGPQDSGSGTLGKGWVVVKCDGKIVSETEVSESDLAKQVIVDIKGCRQLTFESENESGSLNMAAVNITIYPEGSEPEEKKADAIPSSNAAKLPDVCKLMSNIQPYAIGGGITRENGVFDGVSDYITFSMGGVKFNEGLILRASSDILHDNTRSHAIFNLENQFDYISFTNGWVTSCGVLKNDTLRIYADDKIVFEMPQIATSPNKNYEVPINRCAKLMFELRGQSSLTHPAFGVADIVLYRGKPVSNTLFVHPVPELPEQTDLIDLGAPYIHYVPTMKDWPDKIFYDGSTQRRYFENGTQRINKGFMLQTSVHFDLEMGPGSDPGVGVMAAGMGASMMVGTVGGMTISAVFPFGCLLALASGGTGMESSCAAFNTWGAYNILTFTVASYNPTTTNRKETLIIGGDGEALTEIEINEQMEPKTVTVPINKCSQLMFWLKCGNNTSGKYIFYDLKLSK